MLRTITVPSCGRCCALRGHIVGADNFRVGSEECHRPHSDGEFCCHHCDHVGPAVQAMCSCCDREITPDGKCGCKGIGRAMNFTGSDEEDPQERASRRWGIVDEHNPEGDKYL